MPKTKFQGLIFTIMMVFAMVYVMTVYNISMETGGLRNSVFKEAIYSMWIPYFFAFIVEKFIVANIAKKLVFRILSPEKDNPIFMIIATSVFMTSFMAPTMSLFMVILHNGITGDLLSLWLTTAFKNFPMALCSQIFFIGPLVRFIFRNIFRKQLLTLSLQRSNNI